MADHTGAGARGELLLASGVFSHNDLSEAAEAYRLAQQLEVSRIVSCHLSRCTDTGDVVSPFRAQGGAFSTRVPVPPSAISRRRSAAGVQARVHDHFSSSRGAMRLPDGRGAAIAGGGYGAIGRLGFNDEQDKLVQTLVAPALIEESKIVTVAAADYHTAAVGDLTGRRQNDDDGAGTTRAWCRRGSIAALRNRALVGSALGNGSGAALGDALGRLRQLDAGEHCCRGSAQDARGRHVPVTTSAHAAQTPQSLHKAEIPTLRRASSALPKPNAICALGSGAGNEDLFEASTVSHCGAALFSREWQADPRISVLEADCMQSAANLPACSLNLRRQSSALPIPTSFFADLQQSP